MKMTAAGAGLARVVLAVGLATAVTGAVALAQEPPKTTPASGYQDPEGVPVRPPAIDVDPVWAKPAIDTLATIRKRGTLRVGVVDNPPFVMRNAEGELAGFSIDLGRQMAADLGVEVEFVPTSWSQVVADLVGRQFDVIASGLWVTPARALVVNFTEPTSLQRTSTAAATRKGDPNFLNFIDSWLAFQREDGWLAARQHYWFRITEWMKGMQAAVRPGRSRPGQPPVP